MNFEKLTENLGNYAGVSVGENPWDIKVKNHNFYKRLILKGSLGLGESYMEGWWDCDDLEEFFYRIIKSKVRNRIRKNTKLLSQLFIAKILNQQTIQKSKKVIDIHYNLDIEIFEAMLGETMAYTCGYWKNAESLDEAQYAKFDLICKKLDLKKNDKVLDIGSGFGGLANYMAEHYGAKVTGINISKSHHEYAQKQSAQNTEFFLCDYRKPEKYIYDGKKFDKIVSVGMFEAVGTKNFKRFFNIINKILKDEGLFLLHTIGTQKDQRRGDPWILKYIFPGGIIPLAQEITASTDELFVLEDWHNFGHYYNKTIKIWYENFKKFWVIEKKRDINHPFYRMWEYYLLMSAAGFRARDNSLWQIVFSKGGCPGGYTSIR
jgi:cyclopropane-fatty-acyl-phospholipid synthase